MRGGVTTFATFTAHFSTGRERAQPDEPMDLEDQNSPPPEIQADPPADPQPEVPAEPVAPAAPAPAPTRPSMPPAAQVVIEGKKTERELALERDLKERELRVSQLEDENRRLKTIPAPATEKAKEKHSWLSGATFFED